MSEYIGTAPEGPIRERWVRFVLTGEPEFEVGYRECMFIGDFGVGKTRALLDALMLSAINYPGARLALLRDTFANVRDSILPILQEVWAPMFRSEFAVYVAREAVIRLANGSRIHLFGLDTPETEDKLKTSEYFRIFVDQAETIPEEAWDLALARTRQKVRHKDADVVGYNYIKGAANWDKGENWIWRRFRRDATQIAFRQYETVVENRDLGVQARRLLVEGTARENLSLPENYFEAIALMSEATRQRYFSGAYVKGQGLVFPEFNYNVHVVDRIELPGEAPVFVGGDIGIHERHPTAFVFAFLDPHGQLNITHDVLIVGRPLTDVARQISILLTEYHNAGHDQVRIYVDRDAWKRERSTGAAAIDAFISTLRQEIPAGMQVTVNRGRANVEFSGTSAVKTRLGPLPSGAPGIVVARQTAPNVVEMFRVLTWEDLDRDRAPVTDVHDAVVYLVTGTPARHAAVAEATATSGRRPRKGWREWRTTWWH